MNPYKHKFYCFDDHEVHTVETNAVVVCVVGIFSMVF